jgi:hypothetical protein
MKTPKILSLLLLFFVLSPGHSQEKTDISTGSVAALLHSKKFEFIANTVIPMNGAVRDVVGANYSISFSPEMIVSHLPFYGVVHSGGILNPSKGNRFEGKPEEFIIEDNGQFRLKTTVSDAGETFEILLEASNSGYATVSVSSNNRATVTYQGEIVRIKEK